MAAQIIVASDQVIAEAGWIIGFHDWWGMDGYDTATRQQLTAYVGKILKYVKGVHLLAQSKLVVMGINVANLVLHQALHAYRERLAFEQALAKALNHP